VCAESKNFIERRPGESRTQAFLRNLLAERVVIAVEKPTKLFAKRLVVPEEGTQHEGLEKPCGMTLVPFHRTGFWTRLNHLVFSRNIRSKSVCRRPHDFVLGSDGSVPPVASSSGANSLQTPSLASRCGSTGLSHSVLLRSFSFAHTGLIRRAECMKTEASKRDNWTMVLAIHWYLPLKCRATVARHGPTLLSLPTAAGLSGQLTRSIRSDLSSQSSAKTLRSERFYR
jgi:hypothetical protein